MTEINTKEDRQLLYTYLVKLYGSEKAKELMLEHKNNLFGQGGLSFSLGRRSIPFFCLYYLQDIFRVKENNDARELAPFHYEVWDTLEDMIIKDEFDKLVLVLPRGHSKTTTITFANVVHMAVYQESFYTIVQGKTQDDAQKFIFEVRSTLENNEYIKETFGDLINSRKFTVNKDEIHLTNNCKIEALSSSSSMRGRKHLGKRPTAIICDDIQGLDDVISDQAKIKKMETFQKDVLYAGDTPVFRNGKKVKAGTKYIVLGTTLASDCFISQLLRDKTYNSILKRGIPVDDFDVDDYFNNDLYWKKFKETYFDNKNEYGQVDAKNYYYENEAEMKFPVLWADKWSCLELALEYYSNPLSFKSEIMNDTKNIGEKCFFQVKTETPKEIESNSFISTVMVCDPAVGTKARNDYTSILVGSKVASTGHRYIRKGLLLKVEFDDYVGRAIELLKDYTDVTHVIVEKNTFQGVDVKRMKELIDIDPDLKGRSIIFVNDYQKRNKENKIRALTGKINNGFIIFNKEDEDFYKQVLDYQGEGIGNDDAADTVAEFDIRIDDLKGEVKPIRLLDRRKLGL